MDESVNTSVLNYAEESVENNHLNLKQFLRQFDLLFYLVKEIIVILLLINILLLYQKKLLEH